MNEARRIKNIIDALCDSYGIVARPHIRIRKQEPHKYCATTRGDTITFRHLPVKDETIFHEFAHWAVVQEMVLLELIHLSQKDGEIQLNRDFKEERSGFISVLEDAADAFAASVLRGPLKFRRRRLELNVQKCTTKKHMLLSEED